MLHSRTPAMSSIADTTRSAWGEKRSVRFGEVLRGALGFQRDFRQGGAFALNGHRPGEPALRFNDLRDTAVTLLAEAGCEVPQIASITGHTLQSATRILEKYLAMTPALSKAAIQVFENSPATAFADQLQTGPPGEGAGQ